MEFVYVVACIWFVAILGALFMPDRVHSRTGLTVTAACFVFFFLMVLCTPWVNKSPVLYGTLLTMGAMPEILLWGAIPVGLVSLFWALWPNAKSLSSIREPASGTHETLRRSPTVPVKQNNSGRSE